MDALLYPVLTIFYLGLFIWSFRTFHDSSFWGTSWLLFIMVGLIYDTTIISLGNCIGPGSLLETFSLLRYFLKVFLMPTVIFIAWDILRRVKVEWSNYLSARIAFNLCTFVVTVIGVFTEILLVTLQPVEAGGVLRYVQQGHPFPYGILLTFVPLWIAGVYVWREERWPLLLGGVVLCFVLSLFSIAFGSLWLSSLWEFLLVFTLVLSEWKLRSDDYA
ncbi:hypothetical protein SAMN05444392_10578 [Seinonella peptonophila]|uniref:Uncharacterized protein n=1 Tax=Seinonella peptonophila TaxID=112248 RepID=A0A1M4XN20_9BACL|nr:hypothetical protein [Seinonella peptonophila]SHE94673.1 hypothetical protein SAMN05444392_10578 [Seinonella peptonophila]